MRLIDADALLEKIDASWRKFQKENGDVQISLRDAWDFEIADIDDAPTANGTATWIIGEYRSAGGGYALLNECTACHGTADKMTEYCPNCGRRMQAWVESNESLFGGKK